jgi:NTE family protein
LNGRLLVDGGLAENLPINVARAMHADILIVSDVSYPLQPRIALDSALSISNQMLAILVRKDSDRQRASLSAHDILIEPTLGTATSTDFSVPSNVIASGEAAAHGSLARLQALGLADGAYRDYLARRASREPGLPPIQFVRVDEQSKRYEKTIIAEMKPLVGKPLDADQVGKRITELYGLGNFETLDYTLVDQHAGAGSGAATGAGATSGAGAGAAAGADAGASSPPASDDESGLEVRARRKSWGPNYLRFGLNLEDDFQGNGRYNAAARFVLTEMNELGAELLTDVQIGNDVKLASEFYQPLDPARTWFVAPSARIEVRDLPIYTNNLEVADFRDREAEADFDFGRNIGNWGEIRAGYHRTSGETHARFGDPGLVEQQYNSGEYFFKFSYDRLDNVHFPRDGQTFTLQWDANRTNLGADISSDKVTADWLMARSYGRNTILLWTSAGTTLDGDFKPNDLPEFYSLGGFFNLSGLAPQSLIGPNYAIARAIYFRKIGRGGEGFFEFPAYVGMSFELGNTYEHRGDIGFGTARKDASVFVAFDTFLGPIYLGTGYDQRGTAGFYLFLGRTF